MTELTEWVIALAAVEKPDRNSKKWLVSYLFRTAPSPSEATAVKEKEWVCVGLKSWQSVSKTEQSSEETGPVASYFDNTKNVTLQVDTSKQLRSRYCSRKRNQSVVHLKHWVSLKKTMSDRNRIEKSFTSSVWSSGGCLGGPQTIGVNYAEASASDSPRTIMLQRHWNHSQVELPHVSSFPFFSPICCPLNSPERLLYLSDFIPVYNLSYISSHMVFLVQWLCDHSIAQRWKLHVKVCLPFKF